MSDHDETMPQADAHLHVFDQTNGVLEPDAERAERLPEDERIRRRRESSEQAAGIVWGSHL